MADFASYIWTLQYHRLIHVRGSDLDTHDLDERNLGGMSSWDRSRLRPGPLTSARVKGAVEVFH
jgi:hypothetical protein